MVPLIFPSLNNRSRFRGVSSSSVRWSSHGGHVLDVDELFVSNRRAFRFCSGEPREDGARKEKSETKLSRENSRKKEDGLRPKKDFKRPLFFSLWGKKRVFETFFSTKKGEKDFLPFFHSPSSESVNKREGRKGKKK